MTLAEWYIHPYVLLQVVLEESLCIPPPAASSISTMVFMCLSSLVCVFQKQLFKTVLFLFIMLVFAGDGRIY